MAKERHQKLTDRSNIDEDCLRRLNIIHNLIKDATNSNTVAILPQKEQNSFSKYDLSKIKRIKEIKPTKNNPNPKPYVSVATIYRDLALLRAPKEEGGFGAPIDFDRAKGGYYYTDPNYNFISDSSSPENFVSLVIAKNLLSELGSESPIYKKISEVTKEITSSEYSKLTERIAIAPRPQKQIDKSIWKIVSQALSENKIIKLNVMYYGMNKPYPIEYVLSPYQLIFDEGNYYLYGMEHISKDFNKSNPKILISLNDVYAGELTNETFELPQDFSYHKEETKYVIKLFSTARNEIVNCPFAKNQEIVEENEEEKSITISFYATESNFVHKWCMEHGCNIIPLEPQNLIDSWKNEIFCLIKKSGIDFDWTILNRKSTRNTLKRFNEIIQEMDQKYSKNENNMELIFDYIVLLINVRANIPLEYLENMKVGELAEYILEYIIPNVSNVEIRYLIVKTKLRKSLKLLKDPTNEYYSKRLIELRKSPKIT